MDRVHNVFAAAGFASLAGVPLLIAMSGIGMLLSGDPVHVDLTLLQGLPIAMFMLLPAAWIVAIVPNLLGAHLLGWLGRGNVGVRLPAVWAIAGAAAAGVPAWLMSGIDDTWRTPAAMAGIGAVNALLCRAKIRWDDTVPPANC